MNDELRALRRGREGRRAHAFLRLERLRARRHYRRLWAVLLVFSVLLFVALCLTPFASELVGSYWPGRFRLGGAP